MIPLFTPTLLAAALGCGAPVQVEGPTPYPAPSPAFDTGERLAALFDTAVERHLFRGAVLVMQGGEVLFERAHGHADAQGRETTLDAPFYLASLSKMFTVAAIMRLAEAERLAYDDPLSRHLPELGPWAEEVTLRHLLTNTSGLGDYLDVDFDFEGLTNRTVLAHLSEHGRTYFPPGARYRYSNSGYLLLARVVERVSGLSFREFTSRELFGPLGMRTAIFDDETHPAIPARVHGFDRFGRPEDSPMFTNGAGGMYASARDLALWCRTILEQSFFARETWEAAFTPMQLADGSLHPYGFGWHLHESDRGQALHHTGGFAAFANFLFLDLSDGHAVIMLTNGGESFPLPSMATAVTEVLRGRPATLPEAALVDHLFALSLDEPFAVVDEARRIFREEPQAYRSSEDELNDLGYALLEQGQFDAAQAMFELVIERYPGSANAYDSYGEAMLRAGADAARANYRRSLELDPENDNARAMLERIRRLLE